MFFRHATKATYPALSMICMYNLYCCSPVLSGILTKETWYLTLFEWDETTVSNILFCSKQKKNDFIKIVKIEIVFFSNVKRLLFLSTTLSYLSCNFLISDGECDGCGFDTFSELFSFSRSVTVCGVPPLSVISRKLGVLLGFY